MTLMSSKMTGLLIATLICPTLALAKVENYLKELGLDESEVEFVTEISTQGKAEWTEGQITCVMVKADDFVIVPSSVKLEPLTSFKVLSTVELGGPTCPGQIMECETDFQQTKRSTDHTPNEWDVVSNCEDPT